MKTQILEKLKNRSARIGVVGLGYVGLPLAVEFAHAGFHVTGLDIDERKTSKLNAAESYIQDIPTSVLKPLVDSGRLDATTDFSILSTLSNLLQMT